MHILVGGDVSHAQKGRGCPELSTGLLLNVPLPPV